MNGRAWVIGVTIASATALHIAGRDALALIYWIMLGLCLSGPKLTHIAKEWR